MALVGNLKDLKLPSLIQLNCMERNTTKLTIEYNGKYGFLYFDKGQVVHAEFEPDIGEKAVYRLMALHSGNFKVESGIRPPVKSIHTSWNNLLLEGLHQLDLADGRPESKHDHLFERLLTVRGVRNVWLISNEGDVLATTPSKPEIEATVLALAMYEGQKFGQELRNTDPEFMSVVVSGQRFVMTPHHEAILVIELDNKMKLDVVIPFIKQAIG